jgi:hypothetical protein
MPECAYCGSTFESEESLVDHLGSEHEGELSSIDQRRVTSIVSNTGWSQPLRLGVTAIAILALLGAAFLLVLGPIGGSESGIETGQLPDRGAPEVVSAVQQHPSEGNAHVEPGTRIQYEVMPPVSGPHYPTTVDAGFYAATPPLGALVHSLEHGAVIIYYDPTAIDESASQSLKAFTSTHTGTWSSVIVAPNPADVPSAPYVLTAWRHSLELDQYDPESVRAFLAEYLGRGPEHPVR